jgi:hypothetical protein
MKNTEIGISVFSISFILIVIAYLFSNKNQARSTPTPNGDPTPKPYDIGDPTTWTDLKHPANFYRNASGQWVHNIVFNTTSAGSFGLHNLNGTFYYIRPNGERINFGTDADAASSYAQNHTSDFGTDSYVITGEITNLYDNGTVIYLNTNQAGAQGGWLIQDRKKHLFTDPGAMAVYLFNHPTIPQIAVSQTTLDVIPDGERLSGI